MAWILDVLFHCKEGSIGPPLKNVMYYELQQKGPKPTTSKTLEELEGNPFIGSSNLAHDRSLDQF
jgi:hypothetical protein